MRVKCEGPGCKQTFRLFNFSPRADAEKFPRLCVQCRQKRSGARERQTDRHRVERALLRGAKP